MILSHIISMLRALIACQQYSSLLNISRTESIRYFKKSTRLALCFAGFVNPWNVREAWRAGEAAFFCCAYDVLTDWRDFDSRAGNVLMIILERFSQPNLYSVALALFENEKNDKLANDGLERGAITLRFILTMMGCERERENAWGDLDALGQLLQIVDDVFDYEDDIEARNQNSLITENKDIYLERLLTTLNHENCRRMFGMSVLTMAIAHARKKGLALKSQRRFAN